MGAVSVCKGKPAMDIVEKKANQAHARFMRFFLKLPCLIAEGVQKESLPCDLFRRIIVRKQRKPARHRRHERRHILHRLEHFQRRIFRQNRIRGVWPQNGGRRVRPLPFDESAMSIKVITGKVRASFVHVFEPQSINGSEPKYSCSLIIPKSDTVTVGKIREAIEQAKQEGVPKWGGKIPPNLKLPLRDGDVDRPEDPAYADSYFINATSQEQPGVVDRKRVKITDPLAIYSGCYLRASINIYPFNANGNRGIAAGLSNIQFWEDGEPLNGRVRAEDEFDALDDDDADDFLD